MSAETTPRTARSSATEVVQRNMLLPIKPSVLALWRLQVIGLLALVALGGCQQSPARAASDESNHSDRRLEETEPHGNALSFRVLSQATGEHLHGITVLSGGKYDPMSNPFQLKDPYEHGERHVLIEGACSPILLPPKADESDSIFLTYFVKCPGFAWKAIEVNAKSGGEREVRLDPGGELAIQFVGDPVDVDALLQVRSTTSENRRLVSSRWAVQDRLYHYEDFPIGHYKATVRASSSTAPDTILGEVEFEVRDAESTSKDLRITAHPERKRPRHRLTGTISVPPEWNFSSFDVMNRFDDHTPGWSGYSHQSYDSKLVLLDDSAGLWSFDFGPQPAGLNRIELFTDGFEFSYGWPLTVGPGEPFIHKLRLPAPATVVVRLVDVNGAALQAPDELDWAPLLDLRGGRTTVQPQANSATYEFRAPIGALRLDTRRGEYVVRHATVEVKPGQNEFVFTLRKGCHIALRLFDGTTPVPLSKNVSYDEVYGTAKGDLYSIEWIGRDPWEHTLPTPGKYAFKLATIDGFEPIPPQFIHLSVDTRVEHTVQLIRTH